MQTHDVSFTRRSVCLFYAWRTVNNAVEYLINILIKCNNICTVKSNTIWLKYETIDAANTPGNNRQTLNREISRIYTTI